MSNYRLFLSLLCLVLIAPAHAEVDAMQLRLLEAYSQELRWDNIESAPEWINGIKPEYHDDWQMHRVLLSPQQQTTIMLPAYESFRLYQAKQILTGNELDVYASNGTGLAVKQTLQRSTDGHSLVLSPHSSSPLLIHIASRSSDFAVALFVSRKEVLNDIAPYRNPVWSTANWCLLAQQAFALPELYNRLSAGQKQSFEMTGPARLAIKNRLDYEQHASELIQDYRIQYWLDQDEVQELSFSTSVETSRVVTVNTRLEVVGREQQAYLEIPEGRHKLMMQADRPLFLQVLAQTEQDYLFSRLNNPRVPVEAIRKQDLLPSTELMLQAQTAKRIAQNNSRQAGGMVAGNLLREAALQREDYPEGLTEAEQLRGFRSFYRDLLPSNKVSNDAQFMAYFLAPSLHAVNRPQSDAILADQHLAEALKRVGNGYFTAIVGTANEYTLPEQQTAGSLRLVVDKRDCVPRRFHLAIDRQAVKEFWLRCEQDMQPESFARSLAETALARLQQQPDSSNISLDALFSAHSQAAPIIATAVYELPLAKEARTIKIWQADRAKPANIALQYRAAKTFALSEHSYLALLRDASPAAGQRLANELLPLQRLLQAEYGNYKASVASAQTPSLVNNQALAHETELAKTAEQNQQWLEALEHWGKAVNSSTGLIQQQAQLAQANALSKLGEDYLAESLRRYLSLYAETSVAEQAVTQLSERYQAQQNNAALLMLAAAMQVRHPGDAHNRLLLDALLKNGEHRFALLLGLRILPKITSDYDSHAQRGNPVRDAPASRTAERFSLHSHAERGNDIHGVHDVQTNLLTAAYRLQWWETYQQLQAQLPPEKRAFWQGLKAQQQGDYQSALQAWQSAELKPWHDYLQQGLALRERLTRLNEQNMPTLYQQWAQWQLQHPGAKTSQNALWHVKDYAGSDSYYAVERDVYALAVRADAQRPVTLTILGPATLNLQIRPLHPAAESAPPLDGWLQIKDNNEALRYPYTNNLPAQGLTVTGADDLQLGSMFSLAYQVGQGLHELKLSSEQAPLSINIQELRPELPLSVLPILQADTLAEMAVISRVQHRSQ